MLTTDPSLGRFLYLYLDSLWLVLCLSELARVATYKVTISDTVSYNEFTAKYDIVKTEGKIITVRLKDTVKENNKAKESKED